MTIIRIVTRTSELALRQARMVQAALTAQALESELVTYRGAGPTPARETAVRGG